MRDDLITLLPIQMNFGTFIGAIMEQICYMATDTKTVVDYNDFYTKISTEFKEFEETYQSSNYSYHIIINYEGMVDQKLTKFLDTIALDEWKSMFNLEEIQELIHNRLVLLN